VGLFDSIKNKVIGYNGFGELEAQYCRLNPDAKKEWIRIFDKITDMQNSENENEYMKSILPKQKSYVARFALLLNAIYSYEDENVSYLEITKKSVLNAEKLSDYFILMAKKNKFETIERQEMKDVIKFSGKRTAKEQFEALYSVNKELNRSKVAEELNVSRRSINNWIVEFNKK
jgi:hypothetical protein